MKKDDVTKNITKQIDEQLSGVNTTIRSKALEPDKEFTFISPIVKKGNAETFDIKRTLILREVPNNTNGDKYNTLATTLGQISAKQLTSEASAETMKFTTSDYKERLSEILQWAAEGKKFKVKQINTIASAFSANGKGLEPIFERLD